jgi:hypothetical protein
VLLEPVDDVLQDGEQDVRADLAVRHGRRLRSLEEEGQELRPCPDRDLDRRDRSNDTRSRVSYKLTETSSE